MFVILKATDQIIDKVYIDESCKSKTVVDVLLAWMKRVGYMTHLFKNTIPIRDPLSVRLGPRFSLLQCLRYESAR